MFMVFQTTAEGEIFLQCVQANGSSNGVGVVVIRNSGSEAYTVYKYLFEGNRAIPDGQKVFSDSSRIANHIAFQAYVRELTNAEAIPYIPDTEIIRGRFAKNLEAALKEHI